MKKPANIKIRKRYNITLDPDVHDAFAEYVKQYGLSVSGVIELMMKTMLKGHKEVFNIFDGIYKIGLQYKMGLQEEKNEAFKKAS